VGARDFSGHSRVGACGDTHAAVENEAAAVDSDVGGIIIMLEETWWQRYRRRRLSDAMSAHNSVHIDTEATSEALSRLRASPSADLLTTLTSSISSGE